MHPDWSVVKYYSTGWSSGRKLGKNLPNVFAKRTVSSARVTRFLPPRGNSTVYVLRKHSHTDLQLIPSLWITFPIAQYTIVIKPTLKQLVVALQVVQLAILNTARFSVWRRTNKQTNKQTKTKWTLVNASAHNSWSNGDWSRHKLKTWLYLRRPLARPLRFLKNKDSLFCIVWLVSMVSF